MNGNIIEKLKNEVEGMAKTLEYEIKSAKGAQTEAYNLPWGLGRAYVETSRDQADDKLFEAVKEAISHGKSIWTRHTSLDMSQRRELIEAYVEAMGKYLTNDQILEIKNAPETTK